MELMEWIQRVSLPDEAAMDAARERQAQLAKPPGSLGRLEDLSIQLAGITGKVHNSVKRQHLLVFAADNGVVEEGVSSAPQSVTLSQTINLTRAKTGASTLCKHFGCEITVCDDSSFCHSGIPAVRWLRFCACGMSGGLWYRFAESL